MSVIIEGLTLPKHNPKEIDKNVLIGYAIVKEDNTAELCLEGVHYLIKMLPTPHSRLIDADKLQTAIHGLLCENCVTFSCEKGIGCLIEDVFNLIDEAPAVIEAEHESEAQKWARVGRDISKRLQEGIEAIDSEGIEE